MVTSQKHPHKQPHSRKIPMIGIILLFMMPHGSSAAEMEGLIPAFRMEPCPIELHRLAQRDAPFVQAGRKCALIGTEGGQFEAWAYPLKLVRQFEFSFFLSHSTRPIRGQDIAHSISVTPEAGVITFTDQSFTVRAIFVTPLDMAGAVILLDIHSDEPLTVVCGFTPVLQPMWPAGIGGQYAYWDESLKAYIISESSKHNHALVGSPAGQGISYTPAHMLSDASSEFKIEISDPHQLAEKFIPIVLAGGRGNREDIEALYKRLLSNPEKLYRDNVDHFKLLREKTLRVTTPNPELDLAFEWAKVTLDSLVVDNPSLGRGLIAGLGSSGSGGRPGFGWFFGGDACINTLSLDDIGAFDTARSALAFLQKWQRNDGKMAHELSQAEGYVDWFKDYHFGYIHGDTTPYYLVALHDYYKQSGDVDFIRQSWDSIQRAYDWCLTTDANNDGLMDNAQAGLGALEFGELTGIESDIYLNAVWVRAAFAMQELARAAGQEPTAKKAGIDYARARRAFDEKFWDADARHYAFAFNDKGSFVKEVTPWSSVGLAWRFGDSERSTSTLDEFSASDLVTDWGVRSISARSTYYEPLNYNYGAIWPFLNGWIATAQFVHHQSLQGFRTLDAMAQHTFDNELGSVTELYSGERNIWPQEAVPHQGFSSSGVILPYVRGLLGLDINIANREIQFAPHFPADWNRVVIENMRAGAVELSMRYRREHGMVSLEIAGRHTAGYRLQFSPAFGCGTKILSASINGHSVNYREEKSRQTIQPAIEVPLVDGNLRVELRLSRSVELLPISVRSHTGDSDHELKIISFSSDGDCLKALVEGLSGESYILPVTNADLIVRIEGGSHSGNTVSIKFPEIKKGEFVQSTIKIHVKDVEYR